MGETKKEKNILLMVLALTLYIGCGIAFWTLLVLAFIGKVPWLAVVLPVYLIKNALFVFACWVIEEDWEWSPWIIGCYMAGMLMPFTILGMLVLVKAEEEIDENY